ncbi:MULTISPECIES: hypothetical protein [Pseudomonas]|jgi:hypothetical protein|uniref:Ribbon-helix-helix protein, CopG family n=2 Tax=Pseudomonas TaxID=286 RepID=A0A923FYR6_9PSED|nr:MULTISPECIES: hypothetical protein [Pseudomonas]KIC79352.1 hypothetical protein RR51_27300 [Pseudomonas sp. C5pp]MBO2923785.1 hypothetical protein [Pseudomonas asiatica]MBV4536889.1 hypothetical protein [Pseudomonas urmiensis]MDD2113800.1 hypothetical protein [Pseudomonas asiatica]MDI3372388.1 hypothetical protein [Pseudomonas sp. V104_10]
MPIEDIGLDQGLMEQLEREATRRGISPEALAADLIRRELANRTKPRSPRGAVMPFHRKA